MNKIILNYEFGGVTRTRVMIETHVEVEDGVAIFSNDYVKFVVPLSKIFDIEIIDKMEDEVEDGRVDD